MELVTTDDSRGNVLCDTFHTEANEGIRSTTKQRCEFLDNKLKNYKQDKLKRKLPVDAQLYTVSYGQDQSKIL